MLYFGQPASTQKAMLTLNIVAELSLPVIEFHMAFRVEVRDSNQKKQHEDMLFLRFYAQEDEPKQQETLHRTWACSIWCRARLSTKPGQDKLLGNHTTLLWRPRLLCNKCACFHTLHSGKKATETIPAK